jgi:hypothetical protein
LPKWSGVESAPPGAQVSIAGDAITHRAERPAANLHKNFNLYAGASWRCSAALLIANLRAAQQTLPTAAYRLFVTRLRALTAIGRPTNFDLSRLIRFAAPPQTPVKMRV